MGIPGAFYIENFMLGEFFLVSLILEDIPNYGTINFVCNSWIYNAKKYKTERIFFANKTYLPSETPGPLVYYREKELKTLRGDGEGERKEWERIYDYDFYNDLGDPDKKASLARPVAGGSTTIPYPRRGRTGRKLAKKVDKSAWMTDEEFAREMIAGVNPHIIKRLQEFPPKSKLDSQLYGDNTSTITKENLEPNMEPLAIELSRPHPQADSFGPVSDVYLPASEGVEASIWLLAKAYVVVNDSCYHQLVSHWLNTHAVVEPFIIATNRHLSVVHPIHKLLLPHYHDTMNINALARNVLVNAEGIIESTFLWGANALEMSANVYEDWVFTEQGLPNDLIKRGVAVEDPTSPHGLRLLIEDYPYAADGLEIWAAIKSWVEEYVSVYYKSDADVAQDFELQAFWREVVEVGHGDLKDATWWFKMQTCTELIEACTILIWIASALHAAVNFGQYPYGGYILNRPTKSRRYMPEKGSTESGGATPDLTS
ncbi:hypothetical protein TSUD_410130 [Trifolium subterraneum]|uniref:Lipoxygenase n=1 Tax=Trifolium subterraneum TaxID=3900 RepID=A0A2Z6P789_TRISU|nr:hypothetical protein TSUD_410130 [Trifolium subterraneum]